MKHILIFIVAATQFTLCAHAQSIFCGNEIFSNILHRKYPELARSIEQTFDDALQAGNRRDEETLVINVVVHVVWNDPAENLHDSLIHDQIAVLNEDYNRLNADTSFLRPVFQADAGKPNIRFELADIVRVHTNELFSVDLLGSNLLSEVKHTSQGGSDAWDTESFLNIWVVKIQPIEIFGITIGQILGFAFPPAGLDHWPAGVEAPSPDEDGVVLDYRIIGRNNPNEIAIPGGTGNLTVVGRSGTHEVGHYLGLRHIWGDGGLLGPNDCNQSDGIYDTPFANAQSNFDCLKSKNSCRQIEMHYGSDMPDLIENFMDYSSEDCMNMFTKGQAALMRNVLTGPRSGLIENVSGTTAIPDKISFSITPNPARDYLTLRLHDELKSRATVRITDIHGQTIYQTTDDDFVLSGQMSMDVNGFIPGMYIVEVRTGDGVGVSRLVVVGGE